MKIDNKKFASDFAEIVRLTDKEMFARATTEIKRVLKNRLHFDYDLIHKLYLEDFASHFDRIDNPEALYITGEILVCAETVEKALGNTDTSAIIEKAIYLFIQALSVDDKKISFVAQDSLCRITSRINLYDLSDFLFTKLEVLNIECSPQIAEVRDTISQ